MAGDCLTQKSISMKFDRVNSGFNGLSDKVFATKANSIVTAMPGNSNFPQTVPAIADVAVSLTQYTDALATAQLREKTAVAIKDQARLDLTMMLVQLASSVNNIANGDRAMLVSSGFDLSRQPDPSPLVKPVTVILTDGPNAGELVLKVPGVKGARGYIHEYTPEPLTQDSEWTKVITTMSKCTFKNLVSAQRYWCRVAAIGPNDQVVFSDAVSRVVQ